MPPMKLTIKQYYRGFVSLYGGIAGVPFLLPIIRFLAPDSNTFARYLFPPLGNVQRLALTGTVMFLLLNTIVVFICGPLARQTLLRVCGILLVVFLLSACAWIALFSSYVENVALADQEVSVSVGFQRTPFALREYPHETDWEMLHDRGPWEPQIRKLWTCPSIIVVRTLLWLSYSITLACFLSIISFAAYQHAEEKASSKSKAP